MIVNLKQLFEVVGSHQEIDELLHWEDYELFGAHPFATPIHVVGRVDNQAGIVMLRVTVSFVMQLACDRCLEQFERAFQYSLEHILVTEAATENDEFIILPDRLLNLDDLMEADILLNLPSKLLCKPDCKGLCAVCGNNKNLCDCGCKEKNGDPRFAVLDQLLK